MFADPQTLTIATVATTMPRTQMAPTQNSYTTADGNTAFLVKQNITKARFRREVRLSSKKIAADPISAVNKEIGASVYLVIDEPRAGFTDAEIGNLVTALQAWATPANVLRVCGGEL